MAKGAIVKIIFGLILFIIAIYWIFAYTLPAYHDMKVAEQEMIKAQEDLDKANERLRLAQKAADREIQSFIDRGCVPTAQQYVWECPSK